jgi:XTP/dITP diphosphohydrolase
MNRLLIATLNQGKMAEFASLLSGLQDVTLISPAEAGLALHVPERGESYAENARLKAEAFVQASGLMVLADDSGLEVDALGGRPGVQSARYAGPGASDADRRQKLMQELSQTPPPRQARFVCVVAVGHPGLGVREFQGTCQGEIVLEERGEHGFGYDPLFFVPEYQATMAELPPEVKNSISHRARAVQKALPYLGGLFSGVP